MQKARTNRATGRDETEQIGGFVLFCPSSALMLVDTFPSVGKETFYSLPRAPTVRRESE
jgi:hypothetical protein